MSYSRLAINNYSDSVSMLHPVPKVTKSPSTDTLKRDISSTSRQYRIVSTSRKSSDQDSPSPVSVRRDSQGNLKYIRPMVKLDSLSKKDLNTASLLEKPIGLGSNSILPGNSHKKTVNEAKVVFDFKIKPHEAQNEDKTPWREFKSGGVGSTDLNTALSLLKNKETNKMVSRESPLRQDDQYNLGSARLKKKTSLMKRIHIKTEGVETNSSLSPSDQFVTIVHESNKATIDAKQSDKRGDTVLAHEYSPARQPQVKEADSPLLPKMKTSFMQRIGKESPVLPKNLTISMKRLDQPHTQNQEEPTRLPVEVFKNYWETSPPTGWCDLFKEVSVVTGLGQGTFAQVFSAVDLKSSKNIAVKVMKKETIYQAHVQSMVDRELEILQIMSHRHVCRFIRKIEDKKRVA